MDLALDSKLKIGVITIHRRTEPAVGPWQPTIDELRETVELIDGCGYNSLWCGDHISFPAAILDPLLQLAQAAVVSRRLMFGTSVYLLPLRHPVPVAKQVATLDHLSEGRFIFGVGVGGEFPKEYASCGVPINERGPRLTEAIPLLRKLWSGEPVSHEGRYYAAFESVPMQPPARQPGGPPIWCGGRSDGALARAGRLADGWIAYVVTPEMYKAGLDKIAAAAREAGRGSCEVRHRASAVHAPRRHLREGPRRGDGDLEPALRHGLPPRRRALRGAGLAAAGGRPHSRLPRCRRSSRHPRPRRPLRGTQPADRGDRARRAAAAGGFALDGRYFGWLDVTFAPAPGDKRSIILYLA